MRHIATKGEVVKILEFTHFSRAFKFNKTSEIGRKKEIFHEIKISALIHYQQLNKTRSENRLFSTFLCGEQAVFLCSEHCQHSK